MVEPSPTPEPEPASKAESPDAAGYSLGQLVAYMLCLGTWGFGGPVSLVGYMHRDLVEERGWISEAEYKEGLTLSQIMPGPLAAQVADLVAFLNQPADKSAAVPQVAGSSPAAAPVSDPQAAAPSPPVIPESLAKATNGFGVTSREGRLAITHDGRPFGDFVYSDPKILRPHFQNVHAPDGTRVTRNYPPRDKDSSDHAEMHPGLWLAFAM